VALQRKWLALLSRLSYVRILETPAVLLNAFGVVNRVRGVSPGKRRFNDAGWLEPFCVLKATSQCALAV
jgi:hypothetical protein